MKLTQLAVLMAEAGTEGATATGGNAKAPKFCERDWDDAYDGKGGMIYFRFRNGKTVEFDLNKVNEETYRRLALHGANQKIGDSFAGAKGDFEVGIANAQGIVDQLYAGDWEAEREGGGPRLAELAEAISRIKSVPLEKCKAVVEAATNEERTAWRSNLTVKQEVAKMRLEKAANALAGQQQPQELQVKGL